jgi:NitT/TauT family transport system substrate-binding protein
MHRHIQSLLLIVVACAGLTAAESPKLKVGMIHWIAFSTVNVADAKGFWKEQGLDVQVTNFGSNQELNAALEGKGIQIAIDMHGSWVGMIQDGIPLTLLAETDWSNGGDKIIAKEGFDPKTIKGKKIGVYLDKPSVTYFLDRWLKTQGLGLADVEAIEVEPKPMTDNFIAGSFPVIVNYDPEAIRAEREGKGQVVATSKTFPGVIPEGFVARTDVLAGIPLETQIKFFKGVVKAAAWIKDDANRAEWYKILNAKTFEGESPYSDADLKQMSEAVTIHDETTSLERNRDGGGLQQYLDDLAAFLKAQSKLKKPFGAKDLVDNRAILAALKH